MMVHTITNEMVYYFINHGHDRGEGFGHIDLWDFNFSKRYQVVERIIDIPNDTYWIRVTAAFDSVSECNDEIAFRLDYCENYARGCYAEYEVWSFELFRYRWYYGDDRYDCNELPYYLMATLVLDEPERSETFDDAEEWGEYTGQLLNTGRYILKDVRVPLVEITYFDRLTEELFPKRLTKKVPCATHFLMRN